MRIGMIADNEVDSDVRIKNEAKSLSAAGHEVFILGLNNDSPMDEIKPYYILERVNKNKSWRNKAFFFANIFPHFHRFWYKAILKFIDKFNIEVLHAHDLYMAKSTYEAAKRKKIRWVLDLHENFPEAIKGYKWATQFPHRLFVQPKRWQKFEKEFLPKTDKIVVLSETFKSELRRKYPNLDDEKFSVYPNVPDIEEFKNNITDTSDIPEKGNAQLLFYFGGISKRRGIFTLIEAHQLLIKSGLKVKLLLIGPVDKAERNHFHSAIKHGIENNTIIHYEWRNIEMLPAYISLSDICFSPIVKNKQHDSGIANKVFQYLLFERPIIVSNCLPQKRLVEQANCGLVFESGNSKDLANKTAYLLEKTNEAIEMGKNGKKLIINEYNRTIKGLNLVHMYDDIAKSK